MHVDLVRRELTHGHHVSVYTELSVTNALEPDGLVIAKLHVRVRVRVRVRESGLSLLESSTRATPKAHRAQPGSNRPLTSLATRHF